MQVGQAGLGVELRARHSLTGRPCDAPASSTLTSSSRAYIAPPAVAVVADRRPSEIAPQNRRTPMVPQARRPAMRAGEASTAAGQKRGGCGDLKVLTRYRRMPYGADWCRWLPTGIILPLQDFGSGRGLRERRGTAMVRKGSPVRVRQRALQPLYRAVSCFRSGSDDHFERFRARRVEHGRQLALRRGWRDAELPLLAKVLTRYTPGARFHLRPPGRC